MLSYLFTTSLYFTAAAASIESLDATLKVKLPIGPFQLKQKLFETFSGSLWRVLDSKNNEYNLKTFGIISTVSYFAYLDRLLVWNQYRPGSIL